MRRDKHLTGQALPLGEAVLVVGGLARVGLGLAEFIARQDARRAEVQRLADLASYGHRKGPGGAPLGVPARDVSRQRPAAKADGVAVLDDDVWLYGLIFKARALQQRVALAAGRHDRAVVGARIEFDVRRGGAFDLG